MSLPQQQIMAAPRGPSLNVPPPAVAPSSVPQQAATASTTQLIYTGGEQDDLSMEERRAMLPKYSKLLST